MTSQLAYTFSILIFAGAAILLEWAVAFKTIKQYWKTVMITSLFFVLYTPIESIALQQNFWAYNPERVFGSQFLGAEIETYLFSFLIGIAVSQGAIIFSRHRFKQKT